mgnify:CR=1 FL=1
MKSVLALAVLSAGLWAADTAPGMAQADPYRWCAEMGGGGEGGFTNCYFITREQCEATVAGVGGFCRPNQFYTGPSRTDVPARRDDKKRSMR